MNPSKISIPLNVPNHNLIVILGPTASGKTRLAAQLAYRMGTEIISADSRQVYREMNIGTGKDYDDYIVNGRKIPVHLLDIADPGSSYHLDQFKHDFFLSYENLRQRHLIPILCGGSGLYIQAAIGNLSYTSVPVNPDLRHQLEALSTDALLDLFAHLPQQSFHPVADLSSRKRLIRAIEIATYLQENAMPVNEFPKIEPVIFGLNPDRMQRRSTIAQRLEQRLESGLVEEVQHLLQKVSPEQLIYYGLEYKLVTQFLTGSISRTEMIEQLTIAIQQFAKRQMTFFRKLEKDGFTIQWLPDGLTTQQQVDLILNTLKLLPS